MTAGAVILALCLFQVKHYLADFQWQSVWMIETKGQYGHRGGLAHAGLHGALSLPVLVTVAGWMPLLFAGLILAEFILHYHIDWFKAGVVTRRNLDEHDSAYWHLLGMDQAAHQLTYLAILAVLITAGG